MPKTQTKKVATKGDALRSLREEAGLTQEKLAIDAKTSQRFVSDAESESRDASVEILERVAEALHVKLSEIAHVEADDRIKQRQIELASLEVWMRILQADRTTPGGAFNRLELVENCLDDPQLQNYRRLSVPDRICVWRTLSNERWVAIHDEFLVSLIHQGNIMAWTEEIRYMAHIESILNNHTQVVASAGSSSQFTFTNTRMEELKTHLDHMKELTDNYSSTPEFIGCSFAFDSTFVKPDAPSIKILAECYNAMGRVFRLFSWYSHAQISEFSVYSEMALRAAFLNSRLELYLKLEKMLTNEITRDELAVANFVRPQATMAMAILSVYFVAGRYPADRVEALRSYASNDVFSEPFRANLRSSAEFTRSIFFGGASP